MKKELSLPIAWYPTATAPSSEIGFKFYDVVEAVEEAGVNVHACICDGVSVNRSFFNHIATTKPFEGEDGVYEAPNPYADDEDRTILLIVDPSHLIKVRFL